MDEPQISDDEIIAGVRALHGDPRIAVRILKRKRLKPTAGLTGSYFERVRIEIGGRELPAILKHGGMAYGPQVRERLFFAELAPDVPVRIPAAYGVSSAVEGADGWVLMEALPRAQRIIEWAPEETPRALHNLAALHARYLGDPPASLPQPFTRDLDATLAYLPGGIAGLRQLYEDFPHFPRVISDRALSLLAELGDARRDIFRDAFAHSPQTLLHGDYHRGNIIVRDGEPQTLFDWQFVCAGPPAYDLAVFWLYLGAVNKPGFFRFFDRMDVIDRPMTWEQVLDTYCEALASLRPDADIAAIRSCADAALSWEIVRQVTYFSHGLDNFGGYLRFIYRDHRTTGGWFARWIGIEGGWRMYESVFADFEQRAERMLRGGAEVRNQRAGGETTATIA